MNKKITFPELIEAVAATTETSKRTSEMFLKELFAVVSEALVKGENVKIKNFGVFKLTEVGERKSVNVNTGEEMKIPSHTKVSFSPDKSLADAINMPFSSFEAVELSDNITEDDLIRMTSPDLPDENNTDICLSSQGYVPVRESCYEDPMFTEFMANEDDYMVKVFDAVVNDINGNYYNFPVFEGSDQARTQVEGAVKNTLLGNGTAASNLEVAEVETLKFVK